MVEPTLQHTSKVFYSWDQVHQMCKDLVRSIRKDSRLYRDACNGIVPVARGGLIPATIISHILDVPIRFIVTRTDFMPRLTSGWLVVDDICDTGSTFRGIKGIMSGASFASLVCKPKGEPYCSVFATLVEDNIWTVFPWETE